MFRRPRQRRAMPVWGTAQQQRCRLGDTSLSGAKGVDCRATTPRVPQSMPPLTRLVAATSAGGLSRRFATAKADGRTREDWSERNRRQEVKRQTTSGLSGPCSEGHPCLLHLRECGKRGSQKNSTGISQSRRGGPPVVDGNAAGVYVEVGPRWGRPLDRHRFPTISAHRRKFASCL